MYKDLLILTAAIVFVVDLSGFTQSWKGALKRWLKIDAMRPLKPFDCSLCLSFWAGLIYLLIVGKMSVVNVGVVCGLALLSKPMAEAMGMIRNGLELVVELLNRLIDKLYER